MSVQGEVAPGPGDGQGGDGTSGQGGRKWWVWVAIVAAVLLVASVVLGIVNTVTGSGSGPVNTQAACKATKVTNEALPSVVTITASKGATGGVGSGEIIRSDGYIMTNNHVVAPAVDGGQVSVIFANGSQVPATITGRDPKADIAVVKVNESSLPVIAMGNSSDLKVGSPVVALGAPLGLSNTVTSGIISALGRTVEVPSDNGQTALLAQAIQTDAAINPGNSGGALVDCAGKLVGVPSAGATAPSTGGGSSSGSIGLGFAIPVDIATRLADEIISTGTATHSYFGLQVTPIPASAAQKMGTPDGLYVAGVVPGGPSATAGVQQGDIITEINGQSATAPNELESLTISEPPGSTVNLTIYRAGKTSTVKVTLGAQP
jgi:putative serine protease PepD